MRTNFTIEDLKKSAVADINAHLFFDKKSPKKSKYNNQKIEIDGFEFDSKKEASRYIELRALQTAGEISCLNLQTIFELSVCKYLADFTYKNKEGELVVEDVKSVATRKLSTYRMKNKMMENELGIKIIEK